MVDAKPLGAGGGSSSKTPNSEDMSTIATSLYSSSERSNASQGWTETVAWEELKFGHRIQPYRGYAHCVADVRLASCVLELLAVSDVDPDTVKLLLRALKFLRLCDYSVEDICSILAHATAYFSDAFALCGSHMDGSEVGHVLVTLMFIAHCYVQDETCPLHVWHQHLFRKYCQVHTLNAAILRLLEIRRYVLRLEEEDLSVRFQLLLGMANKRGRLVSAASDGQTVLTSWSSSSSSCLASPGMAASSSSARGSRCPPISLPVTPSARDKESRRDGYDATNSGMTPMPQPAASQESRPPVPAVGLPDLVASSTSDRAATSEVACPQEGQASATNAGSLLSKMFENLAALS